jgi:hypothetical protein
MKLIATTIAIAALRRFQEWAHRVAIRWGCVDDMRNTVTVEILSNR